MTDPSSKRILEEIVQKERELDVLRRELARHRTAVRLPEGSLGLVRCVLADRRVAFVQDEVEEIVGMAALTLLPDSPPWVTGLLRLGNEQIPIFDLAARESGRRREPDPSELIVLARSAHGRVGIVVDELEGLASIDSSSVGIPGADVVFASHVLGIATIDDASTLILSVDALSAETMAPVVRR